MIDLSDRTLLPIGFMDSGLGGLSVLREAVSMMPNEDFIYYGDSQNAPYGTKDRDTVKALTFAVVEKLLGMGIKGLTVACNTATTAAVAQLRLTYPELPIVGIEPAIKPAVELTKNGRILVMATPVTINEEKFIRLLDRFKGGRDVVAVPCPGLMEFVEQGELDGDELDAYFREHLTPYLTDDTSAIVLGCTHYPFIKRNLRSFLGGSNILLLDGSRGTAAELRRRLDVQGLLRHDGHKGRITIINSSGTQRMLELSEKLLNSPTD